MTRWMSWVAGVLILMALMLVTLPYIVRDQVVIWLYQQGVDDARFDALDINWFTGRVRVKGLRAERAGEYPFQLDSLLVDLDYPSLMQKQIRILNLDLQGLRTGLAIREGQQWLGPLNLTELSTAADEQPSPDTDDAAPSPWSFGLDNLQLNAIDWRLSLEQQEQRLELDNLWLGSIYLWQPDVETSLSFNGRINGAPFSLDSTSVPLPQQKHGELQLRIEQLPLKPILGELVPQLDATISTDLSLSAQLDGERISLLPKGSITVDGLSWRDEAQSVAANRIDWQGDASIGLEALRPDSVEVKGQLTLPEGLKLDQTAMNLALTRLGWQGELQLKMPLEAPLQVKLDGGLNSGALDLAQSGEQPLALKLGGLNWQGAVALDLPAKAPMTLALDGTLGSGAVDFTQTTAQPLSVKLDGADWRGNTRLLFADAGIDLSGQNSLKLGNLALEQGSSLDLTLAGLDLKTALTGKAMSRWQLADTALTLGALNLRQGDVLEVSLASMNGALDAVYDLDSGALDLKADTIKLGATDARLAKKPLASVKAVSLSALQLALPLKLELANAQADGIRLARTVQKEPLLALKGVNLKRLAMDQQGLNIDRIGLTGLDTVMNLDESMAPVDIRALQQQLQALGGESKAAQASPSPDKSGSDSADFRVRVAELRVDGESQFRFNDRSTEPEFNAVVAIDKASVKGIDTGSGKQSTFELSGKVNRFASLEAKGKVNLIGATRSGDWSAELKGMDLPSLSPYSIKYTGYFLKNGQLNLALEGTLDEDKLDGKNHIRLNRLEVDPVDQAQIGKFQQQLSMPLGTAVAVLQDSDDNIDLDVPISGSLDDPSFDYQSVINKIAGKGVKQGVMSYLLKAMQPYGALISLAQTAIEASQTGAFITLEPVVFEAGTDTPTGDVEGYLGKLTGLLKERDGLRLNLCGISVAADRQRLSQALNEENAERKEPLEPDALALELNTRLQRLANARAEALKSRLQGDVAADRLFLCYPQIDKEGDPRVEPAL
ncbi:MAG: DUF748 domain-containing protein [Oceanospirillales bacterium]|nr:DUF748 domain-containing protein [Oceanospirillales bacterium]